MSSERASNGTTTTSCHKPLSPDNILFRAQRSFHPQASRLRLIVPLLLSSNARGSHLIRLRTISSSRHNLPQPPAAVRLPHFIIPLLSFPLPFLLTLSLIIFDPHLIIFCPTSCCAAGFFWQSEDPSRQVFTGSASYTCSSICFPHSPRSSDLSIALNRTDHIGSSSANIYGHAVPLTMRT